MRARYFVAVVLLLILLSFYMITTMPLSHPDASPDAPPSLKFDGYSLLVGGQQGQWGDVDQKPELVQLSLGNYSSVRLAPPVTSGSIWFGAGRLNGSEWLISGWGSDDNGNSPFLYTYTVANSTGKLLDRFLDHPDWIGGDVFAISYNGSMWMLSGMGAGSEVTPGSLFSHHHMTLGLFNESSGFTDLTDLIPHQQVGILYTNSWNSKYWLIGGGYLPRNIHFGFGVLFTYSNGHVNDLTQKITETVPSFGCVQRVYWNSRDSMWMIGGNNFLATYDGNKFTDLTSKLQRALSVPIQSVNVVRWNGTAWMLAGGTPKGFTLPSRAWIATYTNDRFTDLSPRLPSEVRSSKYASLVTIGATSTGLWAFGGYADNNAVVLLYTDKTGFVNLSSLINMTYITWLRIVT